eukprot:scaffold2835_cov280-Chaetoceros_neogracile.AAC.1
MSELGWYDDKSAVVNLLQNEEFDGNVIGVNDYSNSASSYTLFVEIKNPSGRSYFLTYNREEGMNANTGEANNKIVVVEGAPNEQSWKLAEIGPNGNYTFPDFLNGRDLVIQVGAEASSSDINYLPVTVKQEAITCNYVSDCPSATQSCTTLSCDSNVCTYSPTSNCCGNGICEESDQGCGGCASDCVAPTHCNEIDGQADTSVYFGTSVYGIVFDVDVTTAVQFYELEVVLFTQNSVVAKVYTKSGSYTNDNDLNNWQLVFNDTSTVPDSNKALITFSSKVSTAAGSTQTFYISYAEGGQLVYDTPETASNSDMKMKEGNLTPKESGNNLLTKYSNVNSFRGGIKYNYLITSPSELPSNEPSVLPSDEPSVLPSEEPSVLPSDEPSVLPSDEPSVLPSEEPSMPPSDEPSVLPSDEPSVLPSDEPSALPSDEPSVLPSDEPSVLPSDEPSVLPSDEPSVLPSDEPSVLPSDEPSVLPSDKPSVLPSDEPSVLPSDEPSVLPSDEPSFIPSSEPSVSMIPSDEPSFQPSDDVSSSLNPSFAPSLSDVPSVLPSDEPSILPSDEPSVSPSDEPSVLPSDDPSVLPSDKPSVLPSDEPSVLPSDEPSILPSDEPSVLPSDEPSVLPSDEPSVLPSDEPSVSPSDEPSVLPSDEPSILSSDEPSMLPSDEPSVLPSDEPSVLPSNIPSVLASVEPSMLSSDKPSSLPSLSMTPSENPVQAPKPTAGTNTPTKFPTPEPNVSLSSVPSSKPTWPMITISPSVFPTVTKATVTTIASLTLSGTCAYNSKMGAAVIKTLSTTIVDGTVNVLGFSKNCANRLGRAAGDSIDILVEIIFESNESGTPPPSPQEVIDTIAQNTASIATIISEEIGIDVIVENVGIIEGPSASPSLSPAPTLSQQPTFSIKPSNEFFPSSSPTQSSHPTSTPTKAEDRTFRILSSFKFDDSRRRWCLQAKNIRVGAKFNMRPCKGGSKQTFYLDEYDELRLRDYPTYCMRWSKKSISLGFCAIGTETSKAKFTYDKNKQSFVVQKPKFQYMVGVSTHNKYEKVRLFKEDGFNYNDSVESWSLELIE